MEKSLDQATVTKTKMEWVSPEITALELAQETQSGVTGSPETDGGVWGS